MESEAEDAELSELVSLCEEEDLERKAEVVLTIAATRLTLAHYRLTEEQTRVAETAAVYWAESFIADHLDLAKALLKARLECQSEMNAEEGEAETESL